MRAYLDLHHMEQIPGDELNRPAYYIPHHAVFNKDKIRVVFNASQQAINAQSLNECLFTGPKLQVDLPIILTRWRFFKVVFVAEIAHMGPAALPTWPLRLFCTWQRSIVTHIHRPPKLSNACDTSTTSSLERTTFLASHL